MKKSVLFSVSLLVLVMMSFSSCGDIGTELKLNGTWHTEFVDEDGYKNEATYTFNNDNTFTEVCTLYDPTDLGTMVMTSSGKFDVRDGVIEFVYDLDKSKTTLDGEKNQELTQILIDENTEENEKTAKYKKKGQVYGYIIESVDDNRLVVSTDEDTQVVYTRQR